MDNPRKVLIGAFLLAVFLVPFFQMSALGWEGRSREGITLKVPHTVVVYGHKVTLLDLFEHESLPPDLRGPMSMERIGEISQEGGVKYIYGEQLREFMRTFLRSHGLDTARVEMDFPRQIVVKRFSSFVSKNELLELYKQHVLEALGRSREDLIFRDVNNFEGLSLPPGKRTTRVVARPGERYLGRVSLQIEFFVAGKKVSSTEVSATVSLLETVVHTVRAVRRNTVIGPEDVELKRITVTDSDQDFFTESEDVEGMQAARNIAAFQPVRRGDVTEAFVVRRGDTVTIIYDAPGFKVTARGVARQNGIQDQIIRVVNAESNRSVECRVVDSQTVQAIR